MRINIDKGTVAILLLLAMFGGAYAWFEDGRELREERKCQTVTVQRQGVVIGSYEKVSKDFIFTGAVWSSRYIIVEFEGGARENFKNSTLVEGDIYTKTEFRQECATND